MESASHPSGEPSILRVLDAAFNRLSEALRVTEDQLRFGDLSPLAQRWQQLRRVSGALRQQLEVDSGPLSLHRNVEGDRLRGLPGSGPHVDRDLLIRANIARAREAARSVEEAIRYLCPPLCGEAEAIRYQIYQLESVTEGKFHRGPTLENRNLYLLVTEELCLGDILETTAAAIEGGASIVQLREKSLGGAQFLERAHQLREITSEGGALLIINDRIEIARLCRADGVHLGQQDIAPHQAREILGPDAIIGLSTHNPQQASAAAIAGADYIGVGPIFETQTKPHRCAVGPSFIEEARQCCELPGYAIGHVDDETIDEVIAAGATRIAVCTGIIASPNPRDAARVLHQKLVECASRKVTDGDLR
ncbi:MAG: thiamine phosphate synthase [Planctomycetota bacterium]|nr:thiamine phosphate synthase [Planctomycetota bacterium]